MSHSEAIMKQFVKDRFEKVFTDGTLKVDDETYHVHQLILKISSPYFVKLFESPLSEGRELELKGVSKETFEAILDFLYGNDDILTLENIDEILLAADMFCIDLLFVKCRNYFENHWREMDNISTVYHLAEYFNLEKVSRQVLLKFTTEYLSTFPLGKEIADVSYEVLIATLNDPEFRDCVCEEQHLMDIIWEWFLYDRDNRLQFAENLINRLHLENVAPSALGSRVTLLQDLYKDREDYETARDQISDIVQKKIIAKKARMAQLRISFRIVDYGEHDVTIVDSINWNIHRFLINYRLQEVLLRDEILYLFGNKKVATYNLRTQIITPSLEFKNSKFRFSVALNQNDLYTVGGVEQVKPNQVTSFIYQYDRKVNQWLPRAGHEAATISLCSPSVTDHDGSVYIAGGETKDGSPLNNCYKYIAINRSLKNLKTTLYVKNPKLAVKGDILYIFSGEKGVVIGKSLQKVHIHNQNKNPLPSSKIKFKQHCKLLDTLTIPEGIVLAFRDDFEPQDVFLSLYHPEEDYLENLGYVRGCDSLYKDPLFRENYRVFLRQY